MSSNKFSLRSAVRPSRTRMLPIPDASVVLKKYGTNAHLWLPGVGYMNGEQAGNYIDSAGTQAGLVDNPVGLVMDAEGSLGAELVTNGDFSNGTTGWTSTGSATVANLSGELEVTGSASTDRAIQIVNLTAGKTYFVSGYARAGTSTARSIIFYSSGFTNNLTFNLVSGNVSGYFTPSVTGAGQIWLRVDVGTAYFDNISVREVTGAITATQGTTANKPILRRGAVNLIVRSQELTAAGWTGSATILVDQTLAPDGTTTADSWARTVTSPIWWQQIVSKAASAIQHTVSIYAKPNTGRYFAIRLQGTYPARADVVFDLQTGTISSAAAATATFTGASATIASAANGFYRCTLTATSDTAATITGLFSFNSNGVVVDGTDSSPTSSGYLWGAQLELGSTASEYIPTTTAAASSSSGDYYWQFDGSNDSLALSSVPFQMADDFAIVIGMRGLPLLPTDAFCVASTSNANALIKLGLSATAVAQFRCQDDAGTADNMLSVSTYTQALVVLAGKKNGNAKTLRVNGVATSSSSTALGTTTLTNAGIGYRPLATPINYMTGSIYPVIAIKGTVSDADLLVLERWVGSLSGVSI